MNPYTDPNYLVITISPNKPLPKQVTSVTPTEAQVVLSGTDIAFEDCKTLQCIEPNPPLDLGEFETNNGRKKRMKRESSPKEFFGRKRKKH